LLDFELKEMVEEKFQIFDRYIHTHTKKRDFSNCRTIVGCNKHTGFGMWTFGHAECSKGTLGSWERDEIRRKSKWGSNLCMRHNARWLMMVIMRCKF